MTEHDEPENEELGITPVWSLGGLLAGLCVIAATFGIGLAIGLSL